jgi:hypothetical protein
MSLFSLKEKTVAPFLMHSRANGLPIKLLCQRIEIVFQLKAQSLYWSNKYNTALGVAGRKSIKSIDESPTATHHIPSISLDGEIVERI